MDDDLPTPAVPAEPCMVPSGEDRLGYSKTLGISSVAFKTTSRESNELFAAEVTLVEKGGPGRHLHVYQDEYFYVTEGEFVLEVGDKRIHLKPGDSAFGPKNIPHVWAFVKGTRGRLLFVVSPAGQLEEFFVNAAKTDTLPGPDQNQWRPYGMEWIGPPLAIE